MASATVAYPEKQLAGQLAASHTYLNTKVMHRHHITKCKKYFMRIEINVNYSFFQPPPRALYKFTTASCLSRTALLKFIWAFKYTRWASSKSR